jgi:DNA polymerase-1
VRRAFVPRDKDHLILAADYSQIELRIVADLSGDKAMREDFKEGVDIHSATAARVYGVELDEVLPEMRRSAKMVNFGIIYRISAFGLGQRLGIPRGEAAGIIEEYFRQYPGVEAYMNECIEGAKEKGYVETITGRRRYLRDINSANANVRAGAERMAINTPIQGSAADMIKIAMCRVAAAMREKKMGSKMLLQVHDELVFDMRKDEEKELVPLVEKCMVGAISLKVPVVVDTGVGENWLEAH